MIEIINLVVNELQKLINKFTINDTLKITDYCIENIKKIKQRKFDVSLKNGNYIVYDNGHQNLIIGRALYPNNFVKQQYQAEVFNDNNYFIYKIKINDCYKFVDNINTKRKYNKNNFVNVIKTI